MKKSKRYRYKNHDIHTVNGYPAIYTNEKCTVYIHRLVAEEMLGRPLNPEEIVHHQDEDRSNYEKENLMIFKTTSDHIKYHAHGVAILNDDGTYTCDDKLKPFFKYSKTICPECGNAKYAKSKLCEKCRAKHKSEYIQSTNRLKPSKEELREELKTNSRVALAKKYGVSDKSIANWEKKYGLRNG